MSITRTELAARLKNACQAVIDAQDELTDIDSHFGDADHGITMTKIASAIMDAAEKSSGGIKAMLDEIAMAVMMINGGSAVPLWNTWLDGLQEGAPETDTMTDEQLRSMFTHALDCFSALSKAKVGDKTMMDTLSPATRALAGCEGSISEMFKAAAAAGAEGAEATKGFVSRFGRARSYGEQTLGTPDAGAVSMKYFFAGLAKE